MIPLHHFSRLTSLTENLLLCPYVWCNVDYLSEKKATHIMNDGAEWDTLKKYVPIKTNTYILSKYIVVALVILTTAGFVDFNFLFEFFYKNKMHIALKMLMKLVHSVFFLHKIKKNKKKICAEHRFNGNSLNSLHIFNSWITVSRSFT